MRKLQCDACKTRIRIADGVSPGRRAKCPRCRGYFVVPPMPLSKEAVEAEAASFLCDGLRVTPGKRAWATPKIDPEAEAVAASSGPTKSIMAPEAKQPVSAVSPVAPSELPADWWRLPALLGAGVACVLLTMMVLNRQSSEPIPTYTYTAVQTPTSTYRPDVPPPPYAPYRAAPDAGNEVASELRKLREFHENEKRERARQEAQARINEDLKRNLQALGEQMRIGIYNAEVLSGDAFRPRGAPMRPTLVNPRYFP